jgi:RNA polymerase sigma-70 factor, ECF subfamily
VSALRDDAAFRELAETHRRELHLHCYRLLGSIQDAEDLVQETLLAAWRGHERFEGRASVRTWLYRIATNRCLNALRDRGRRGPDPVWLEPYPDALSEHADDAQGPDARYEAREAIALAFVVALQRMPPRQRAVLVLRDVLGFRAAEVAGMLEVSEAAVTSALHRARTAVAAAPIEEAPLPGSPAERAVVGEFTDAFERGDVRGVVALLTTDAALTMPPQGLVFEGRAEIAAFLSTVPAEGHLERFVLVPVRANGQPAFGCYLDGAPYGLMVLTLRGDRVAAITGFPDAELFARFGLPARLDTRTRTKRGADRLPAASTAVRRTR